MIAAVIKAPLEEGDNIPNIAITEKNFLKISFKILPNRFQKNTHKW